MKKNELSFEMTLPLSSSNRPKHLKDKSRYNHNYYELKAYSYEWLQFGDEDNCILLEECDEFANVYTYSFGRFVDGKYVKALSFDTQFPIFDDVETI